MKMNMYMRGFLFFCGLLSFIWGIDSERITVNGFSNVEIEKQIGTSGLGDPNGSFDGDLDILLNFQIGEKMRVTGDFSWEHGFDSKESRGGSSLEYTFIEHTITDMLKIRVGKILTPFGIYNEIHRAKPAYFSVKIPRATISPIKWEPNAFVFFPKSGMGIELFGETVYDRSKGIEYNLFVSNGLQDSSVNPFEKDGNGGKAITARIRFEVSEGVQIGKSFYIDMPSDTITELLFTDGYELQWMWEGFQLMTEVVIGNEWQRDKERRQQIGVFIQPAYSTLSGFTYFARGEFYKSSFKEKKDYVTLLIGGVLYEISNWYMIKCELDYFRFGDGNSLLPHQNYMEIKASLVLGF